MTPDYAAASYAYGASSAVATDAALAAAAASQAAVLALAQIVVQSVTALGLAWIGLKTAREMRAAREESKLSRQAVTEKVEAIQAGQDRMATKVSAVEKNTNSITGALVVAAALKNQVKDQVETAAEKAARLVLEEARKKVEEGL